MTHSDYKEVAKNAGWAQYEEYTPTAMSVPGRNPLKRASDAVKRSWKKQMKRSRRRWGKKETENE